MAQLQILAARWPDQRASRHRAGRSPAGPSRCRARHARRRPCARRRRTRRCCSPSAASTWRAPSEAGDRRSAMQRASTSLERALGGTARRSEGLALYGRALYLSGNYSEAERILRDAVATSPVDLEAFAFLADAAERLGHDVDRARRVGEPRCARRRHGASDHPPRTRAPRIGRPLAARRRRAHRRAVPVPGRRHAASTTRRRSACWPRRAGGTGRRRGGDARESLQRTRGPRRSIRATRDCSDCPADSLTGRIDRSDSLAVTRRGSSRSAARRPRS